MKPHLLFLGFFFILHPAVLAQNPNAPGQQKKDSSGGSLDPVEVERVIIDEAKNLTRSTGLGRNDELASVENLLTALNESKPNSPEWRMESAQRLVHLAEQMAREGRPQGIPKLVARALQHLQVADTPAHPAATRASAKALAGFIQERYLADDTAARASYQAAAQLDPDNKSAKETAERLKQKDENEKARPPRG